MTREPVDFSGDVLIADLPDDVLLQETKEFCKTQGANVIEDLSLVMKDMSFEEFDALSGETNLYYNRIRQFHRLVNIADRDPDSFNLYDVIGAWPAGALCATELIRTEFNSINEMFHFAIDEWLDSHPRISRMSVLEFSLAIQDWAEKQGYFTNIEDHRDVLEEYGEDSFSFRRDDPDDVNIVQGFSRVSEVLDYWGQGFISDILALTKIKEIEDKNAGVENATNS